MNNPDVWKEISNYIPKGSWKSYIFTCKYFLSFNNEDEIATRSNHLWTLVQKYPDAKWSWSWVSMNPNITWEIIQDNPDYPWNWYGIPCNPNVPLDIIAKYNPDYIHLNPNVTLEIMQDSLGDWDEISKRASWEIILNNLEEDWEWYYVSENPNVTWNIINKFDKQWFCYQSVSVNVNNNPDYPWNWYGISMNPNITWEIIKNNPDQPWDWRGVSWNPNITFDIFKKNLDKNLDWDGISQNPNLTWKLIDENPQFPWVFDNNISRNSFGM